MNTYYTAKDIEELAAKGTQQLVLNPGTFLTDFARETAQQLGIALVKRESQSLPSAAPTSRSNSTRFSDKYNKPSGCQHASSSLPTAHTQAIALSNLIEGTDSNTVNRLVDLLGKVIKRGG